MHPFEERGDRQVTCRIARTVEIKPNDVRRIPGAEVYVECCHTRRPRTREAGEGSWQPERRAGALPRRHLGAFIAQDGGWVASEFFSFECRGHGSSEEVPGLVDLVHGSGPMTMLYRLKADR